MEFLDEVGGGLLGGLWVYVVGCEDIDEGIGDDGVAEVWFDGVGVCYGLFDGVDDGCLEVLGELW